MSEESNNEESDPELIKKQEEIEIEKEEEEEEEEDNKEKIDALIKEVKITKKNKDRALLIDQLSEFKSEFRVQKLLSDIALNDSYVICRAKAVSYLAEVIDEDEVKRVIVESLKDSSPKVRLWAVWALRTIVHENEILEELLSRLRYSEKSNRVKLWLIRTLSDQIANEDVVRVFIKELETKPNLETRKLILYYLIQRLDNPEICYKLANYVMQETNKEIKLEIVKKLKTIENEDVKYSLNKLSKLEKDGEILSILNSR